MEVINSGIILL